MSQRSRLRCMLRATSNISTPLVAVVIATLLIGVAVPAHANGGHSEKVRDRIAIHILTRAIGANFTKLNECLDMYDQRDCFERLGGTVGGTRIIGLGFAIAAILKFKAHCDDPNSIFCPFDDVDLMVQCLDDGEDSQVCIDTLDPPVQELAQSLRAYRAARAYCGQPGVVCQRFAGWPSSWPWPFVEPPRKAR